jgi:hypothetical protein
MKWRKFGILTKLLAVSLIVSSMTGAMVALATNDVWEIHLPANHATDSDNWLHAVSAASDSAVWAVGSYDTANGYQPLVEKWSGSSWAAQTGASGNYDSELFGVEAISPTLVWAVGYEGSGAKAGNYAYESQPTGSASTFIESTTNGGTSWAKYNSPPSPGSGFNNLRGICAISASDIWAVGFYHDGTSYQTLAVHYNGSTWSSVTTPHPGTNDYLYGVACVGGSDVWAVGNVDSSSLIIHYNGSSWSQVTSPSPGSSLNFLEGVACYSGSECLAVGEHRDTSPVTFSSWSVYYNGTSWTTKSTTNSGTGDNVLASVDYVGESTWAWAVGFYDKPNEETNVMRWDGSSWSLTASPEQNSNDNRLRGVTTIPGSGICSGGGTWAVGAYVNSSYWQTLAESYMITPQCSP